SHAVGGDFINIFRLGKNKAGFYIADVSGHGVSSALVTIYIREQVNQILKNYSRHALTPAKILNQLNANFLKEANFIEDGIYLTIFWGILDLQNYMLSFASAGHHALPLIIDNDKTVTELSDLDIAIGFLEDFNYRNQSIQLKNNMKILLHTDGIIEISSARQEIFGIDRLKDFFITNYHLRSDEFIQKLVNSAIQFSNKSILDDDIALILLELK
ncbi:serine/threonine-protein phosphatase, partial [candidate division KSB1 bacterium]|nr:serine/threonine-protein phosphatase [candidate division KSB1 bacterium]